MGNEQSESDTKSYKTRKISCKEMYRIPSASTTVSTATPIDRYSPITVTPTPTTTPISSTALIRFPTTTTTKFSKRIISHHIAEIAANFWCQNIQNASIQHRLELACSIWFGMKASSIEIQKLMITRFKNNNDLETAAVRNLDMIGFIVRGLYSSNNNLSTLLYKLGAVHNKMGIKIKYYEIMLQEIHETFKYYYPDTYSNEVEFAMDEIFTFGTQLMTGIDMKLPFPLKDIKFLRSLRCCLSDKIGTQYLYRYLTLLHCEEMVMFLYLLQKYKETTNSKQRYMIAQSISNLCIEPEAYFSINISYEHRQNILLNMNEYEANNIFDEDFVIDIDFFIDIEDVICRLIIQTHWKKFKSQINQLYLIE